MNKPVKIYMTLSTRMHGSGVSDTVEIRREEWNEMSEEEREQYVQDVYEQFVWENNYGGVDVQE